MNTDIALLDEAVRLPLCRHDLCERIIRQRHNVDAEEFWLRVEAVLRTPRAERLCPAAVQRLRLHRGVLPC